ncbi:MAG: hypothetical protein JRH11_02930 [Deltaproteobacteria bacterium]|nr:hypothetical protein [Deltaproteobacteria bacterium]
MSSVLRSILLVLALGFLACGDNGRVSADTGLGPDGAADAGLAVTPPDIPWLDVGVPPIGLTPCPEGWGEVTGGDVTECHPYPAGAAATCATGDAHFPAEPGCRAIGDSCPTGDYATTLPSGDRILYVLAGAAAGGDGSIGSPYAGLSDVNWLSVTAGTTVALGRGIYEGTLALKAGAHVVGACAAETIITGADSPIPAVLTVTSAGAPAVVENLAIAGAPQWGVRVESGRSLDLRGVRISGVSQLGMVVLGAGTAVTLTDVVIEHTLRRSASAFGALYVQDGAQAEVVRGLVRGNDGAGVFASGAGTEVALTDVAIQGGASALGTGLGGRGVIAQGGARLEATRLLVSTVRDIGIFLAQTDTAVTLTDTIVEDTQPRSGDAQGGRGIDVRAGAFLEATRVLLSENLEAGVVVAEEETAAVLTDVIIRDTKAQQSDGRFGLGVSVQQGASLEASRVLVSGNREEGILVTGVGAALTLADAVVRDTHPGESNGLFGRGIEVVDGATLGATRVLVSGSREQAVLATGTGTAVTFADVVVGDTLPRAIDEARGGAITGQDEARIEGERVLVHGARGLGVMAVAGGIVNLRDVTVSRVDVTACAATTCPDDRFGYGAAAVSGALRLERFHVSDAATCGVFVAPIELFGEDPASVADPSIDLVSGIISDSDIGACVQVDEYDIDRLQDDVRYRDNGTSLNATSLPVPGVVDAIEP